MAVRFTCIVEVKDIPDASWDAWISMGYGNPVNYLRKQYKATEVPERYCRNKFWREVKFHSRKSYTEFYLTWM